jgi:uncharacterized protein (DUF486 family)
MTNWFKVVALFLIPGLFYTGAAFFHLRYPHWPLWTAILVSIAFASGEYIFRVPITREVHNMGVSNFQIQIVWVVITLTFAYLSERVTKPKN